MIGLVASGTYFFGRYFLRASFDAPAAESMSRRSSGLCGR